MRGGIFKVMSKILLHYNYYHIISLENLLEAWERIRAMASSLARMCKSSSEILSANILSLHRNLVAKTYTHSAYQAFKINDQNRADIHKDVGIENASQAPPARLVWVTTPRWISRRMSGKLRVPAQFTVESIEQSGGDVHEDRRIVATVRFPTWLN